MLDDLKEHVWQANLDLVQIRPRHPDLRQRQRHRPEEGDHGHQAERRLLRGDEADGHRPGGPRRARSSKGSSIPPRTRRPTSPSTGLPGHRRHRPCPQRIRHGLRPGRREIPCLGTTHADHFNGPVPVTRFLTAKEVEDDYEANTGKVIVERFAGLNPARDAGRPRRRARPVQLGRTPGRSGPRTASSWKRSAKMAILTGLVESERRQPAGHLLRQAFSAEARPAGLLRTDERPARRSPRIDEERPASQTRHRGRQPRLLSRSNSPGKRRATSSRPNAEAKASRIVEIKTIVENEKDALKALDEVQPGGRQRPRHLSSATSGPKGRRPSSPRSSAGRSCSPRRPRKRARTSSAAGATPTAAC